MGVFSFLFMAIRRDKEDYMNKHLYLMVINALGIAMFFVIGKFVAIPTPIPNFALFLQYAILVIFGFYFGPITGLTIGFLGHLLIDLVSGYGLWFSWIICSGVFGLLVGLSSLLINHLGNPYKPFKMVLFSLLVAISGAFCWMLIAPIGDIIFYQAPYNLVFIEGGIALAGNISTALAIGLPIIYALRRVPKPYSVVNDNER